MKKSIWICVVLAIAIVSSCKKVKDLATISVNIPYTQHVSIPNNSGYAYGFPLPAGGVDISIPSVAVPTNSKAYLDQYHTNGDKVIKVGLNGLTLQLTAPQNQNFDFLDTVRLYISAPGHLEQLVAYKYGVEKGMQVIALTTNPDVNLKDYFLEETMNFRVGMHINAVPDPRAEMDIKSVFNLVANPLY